jgi:4-hydroxy-tetrahydrodipicolinate synthase
VIRPPHLPLSKEDGDKAWATWQATGALPLPGMPALKQAAE